MVGPTKKISASIEEEKEKNLGWKKNLFCLTVSILDTNKINQNGDWKEKSSWKYNSTSF